MNTPQVYTFQARQIRVSGTPESPLFVAADVCAVLGIANSRDAVGKLDDDEKGVASTDTPGGKQEMTVVTEAGLYTLILRCRDAVVPGTTAHAFRKWVTSEVLPAIRKSGGYQKPGLSALDQLELYLKYAREQERRLAEHDQKLANVEQLAIQANSYNSANTGFLTVRAYANIRGIKLPLSQAKETGVRAAKYCRDNEIKMGRAKDELFGEVNSYPVEVLDEILGDNEPVGK